LGAQKKNCRKWPLQEGTKKRGKRSGEKQSIRSKEKNEGKTDLKHSTYTDGEGEHSSPEGKTQTSAILGQKMFGEKIRQASTWETCCAANRMTPALSCQKKKPAAFYSQQKKLKKPRFGHIW